MYSPEHLIAPPESVCILRLSALGDVTHILPVIHTLKKWAPDTKITWVIGRLEHKLVGHLEGVEFIVFDKKAGWREYLRIRRLLADRLFSVLLVMQVSLRANVLSGCIRAERKIGYDRARAKDFHGCFIDERIPPSAGQHVVDSFFSFLKLLGLNEPVLKWDLPEQTEDTVLAAQVLDQRPLMVISPCSSHSLRNWNVSGYAALADYAVNNYDMQVVICGGPSAVERDMATDICATADTSPLNLVGQDTFRQFLALLRRARVLVSPDSGPAHMGAITDTPVLGLYAASNPRRSGPYKSIKWCVDAYDQVARRFYHKPADQLKWGKKLECPGAMNLITIDQVTAKLDNLMNQEQ